MIILGLDPGLGTTGWGLIAAEGNRLYPPHDFVGRGTMRSMVEGF